MLDTEGQGFCAHALQMRREVKVSGNGSEDPWYRLFCKPSGFLLLFPTFTPTHNPTLANSDRCPKTSFHTDHGGIKSVISFPPARAPSIPAPSRSIIDAMLCVEHIDTDILLYYPPPHKYTSTPYLTASPGPGPLIVAWIPPAAAVVLCQP